MMMCIMARKPLSLARQQDAERLKSIWAAYKDNARASGKKVTQDDVSEACGWATQGAFSAYLNARTPINFDALIKLSNFFDVTPFEISPELASDIGSISSGVTDKMDNNLQAVEFDGLKRIPILTYVQAGRWREAIQLPADDYTFVAVDTSPSSFGAYVVGDSMLPDFKEGDLIIIDTQVPPQPTDYVMAECADGITFKKYRSRGVNENGVEVFDLVPLNPDFPTIRSDRSRVEIIGTVVEHRRTLKRQSKYN